MLCCRCVLCYVLVAGAAPSGLLLLLPRAYAAGARYADACYVDARGEICRDDTILRRVTLRWFSVATLLFDADAIRADVEAARVAVIIDEVMLAEVI